MNKQKEGPVCSTLRIAVIIDEVLIAINLMLWASDRDFAAEMAVLFLVGCCAISPLFMWLPKNSFLIMEKIVAITGIIIYMIIIYLITWSSWIEKLFLLSVLPHLICGFGERPIAYIVEKTRADHIVEDVRVIDNIEYSYKVWYWNTPRKKGYREGKIKRFWIAVNDISVWEFHSHEIQSTDDESVQTVLEEMVSKYN